jgi:REP element-mobilizing transposase RayT
MVRPLRIEYEGALYHITARGNERKDIFLNEGDWKRLLSLLKEASQRYRAIIHAYCFMPNHYHLLIETTRANLSRIMHNINTAYTGYFNYKHRRVGHLFQGRYRAILVDKESYLIELSRYIHLNPVRAKLVRRPQDWPWSSYRDYIGLEREGDWIDKSWIYGEFDPDQAEAKGLYREFVEEGLTRKIRNPFKDAVAQLVLGREEFVEEIRERIENIPDNRETPSRKRLRSQPEIGKIVRQVAGYFGIKEEAMHTSEKRKNLPRQISIYLVRKYTDTGISEIGRYFGGVGYSAVSQIVKRLEEKER